MGHGLGNPRDFGIVPEPEPILDPDSLAVNREILGGADEALPENAEAPAERDDELAEWDATLLDGLDESPENSDLMAYLAAATRYVIAPAELVHFVENGIISRGEARGYLRVSGLALDED